MRSAIIVLQARTGSTRFPGKVLVPFGETTLLSHIVARLGRARHPLGIVVATSEAPGDAAIATCADLLGVRSFRGSEADVLGRVAASLASVDESPELVVRICADRPLICPSLIDGLLEAYDDCGAPDYLSNSLRKSWPEGLDVEIVRADALREAAAAATDPYDREHVTPFLYRNPDRFSLVGLDCPFGNFSSIRATIDTPEDHAALVRVHEALVAVDPEYEVEAVLNLATCSPELFPATT